MDQLDNILTKFSFWSRFLGYLLIVGGGLLLLACGPFILSLSYLGAIGILPIVIGVFLLKAGNRARDFVDTDEDASFNLMMTNLLNYIKWQVVFWLSLSVVALLVMSLLFFLGYKF